MNLRRYLRLKSITLDLKVDPDPLENEVPFSKSHLRRLRRETLFEIVNLFDATGKVVNRNKLFTDLLNREKRASTALEDGVAFPHVRTMQARSFIMAFARSTPGIMFGQDAPCPSRIFFGLIAPPYDDTLYLRIYRTLGPLLLDPKWRDDLLKAKNSHQILRLLQVERR